ncbi:centrosomal protein 104 [Homo sapiens]|uniref:Centrosomal protein 104 n=1 Tax=Homo sapiens TaxID=9606 RepID=A0A6Q8PG89_HUMAN|nr:centrosomal protein 104 [Homo sapiens]KAI4078286.1 centrosomal protein 104 [Homo sapiens]
MPHKIGFVVVSSSGHEDGFSARELMIHAPTVSGWRSPSGSRLQSQLLRMLRQEDPLSPEVQGCHEL